MNMKRFIILILICCLIYGCATIDQFNVDANKSKRFPPSQEMKVGVLTFIAPAPGVSKYSTRGPEGTYTTPANVGAAVANAVSPELMNIPNVILIERSQLEKILNEHQLSLSGVVNNPDFTLLGKILPVDALLIGNVTNFTYWHEAESWGASVAYSARLVNIHTGEVLFTINCSAQKHNGIADKMSQELAKEAIRKALEK
jgi:curli biogenesis system outer membrane secretion channel CsgG